MARDIHPDKVAASCTGKVRFGSYSEASKVGKRVRKNGRKNMGSMLKREPYRCPTCRGYHLGARSEVTVQKSEFRRFMRKYEGRQYGDCADADET